MIVEEIKDRSFGDVLDEYILKPLGMDDTGLDGGFRIVGKKAAGYAKVGFEHVNVPYLNIENIFAAGQMYSTAEDLFAWDQTLYTDLLLAGELREKLFTPYHSNGDAGYSVGYGWEIGEYTISQEIERIGYVRHFGGLNGFNTLLCRLVRDRHTIILLGNLDRAPLEEISIKITSILYGQPYGPPLKPIALELYQIMGKAGAEGLEIASGDPNPDFLSLSTACSQSAKGFQETTEWGANISGDTSGLSLISMGLTQFFPLKNFTPSTTSGNSFLIDLG